MFYIINNSGPEKRTLIVEFFDRETTISQREVRSPLFSKSQFHRIYRLLIYKASLIFVQEIGQIIVIVFSSYIMITNCCRDPHTSLQRNSRIELLSTFLPSACREYGVFPEPFSCISHLSPFLFTTSPMYLLKMVLCYTENTTIFCEKYYFLIGVIIFFQI